MSLQVYPIEEFGGLNLRDDAALVGIHGATRARDVILGDGTMKSRPGQVLHIARTDTDIYDFLYALPSSSMLLTGHDTNFPFGGASTLETYNVFGASVSTNAAPAPASAATDIANAAQAAGTYVALSTGAMRFVNAAGVISAPAFTGFTPLGPYVATTAKSQRLVVNDGAHRVRFSEIGDPLTFLTTSNLDLWPNDSEQINWICTWQDKTFVFKRTKFAVFYNEATADNGLTEFQYRGVFNVPSLAFTGTYGSTISKPVAVGDQGVYFLTRSGVYVTDGGFPKPVSSIISPLFTSLPEDIVAPAEGRPTNSSTLSRCWLHYDQGLLYVLYPTNNLVSSAPTAMAILDTDKKVWYIWRTGPMPDGLDVGSGPGFTALASQPTGVSASTNKQSDLLAAVYPAGGLTINSSPWDLRSTISKFTDPNSIDHFRTTSGITPNVQQYVGWAYSTGLFNMGVPNMKRVRTLDLYTTGSASPTVSGFGGRAPVGIGSGSAQSFTQSAYERRRYRLFPGAMARQFKLDLINDPIASGSSVIRRAEIRYSTAQTS